MNPELRLEELNKTMAELQAEIAQAKADIAAAKAVPEPNILDEAVNIDRNRGLTGNRDAEGSMITAKQMADANTMDKDLSEAQDYKAKAAKEGEETSEPEIQEFDADGIAIPLSAKVAIGVDDDLITKKQMAVPEGFHEMEDGSIMADSEMEESNVMDAESQKAIDDGTFGQKLGAIKIQKGPEDSDIDKDRRMDTTSADLSAGDTDNPQGRNAPQILDFEQRPMGFEEDEGGTSSVNEKDDFWKTEEGYNKAIEMYGEKPAWVKEPTMVYDAAANEYVKIKEEDKEQYEDFGISAATKRMFG